jgi:hypothetical protein
MRDCYTPTSVPSRVPLSEAVDVRPARPALRFGNALCGALIALSCACATLHAQDVDLQAPARLLVLGSAGLPLRLTLSDKFAQKRLAPGFGNVLLGYALPGDRFRHGFGVGVTWNLSHDGGYTDPIYAGDQIALMPAYLAYYQLNTDVFAIGHVGVPILVHGGPSAGLEVGAAIAYRVLAGAGLFAQLDLDGYGAGTFSLLASLELGVVIDYEVLP